MSRQVKYQTVTEEKQLRVDYNSVFIVRYKRAGDS